MWWLIPAAVEVGKYVFVGILSVGVADQVLLGGSIWEFGRQRIFGGKGQQREFQQQGPQHLQIAHNPGYEKPQGNMALMGPQTPYQGALISHNTWFPTPKGWQIDRAVLERLILVAPDFRNNLELAAGLLASQLESNPLANKYNNYSSTFGSGLIDVFGNRTPHEALQAFKKEFSRHGLSNKAIYILGGMFIVSAEAEKNFGNRTVQILRQRGQRWGNEWMRDNTDQGMSRFMWKFTVMMSRPKYLLDLPSGFKRAIATKSPPHGRVLDGNTAIISPTTKFGSSATIMKVMKLCEALGLNQEQCMCVALAVLQHWSDKHLNGRSERHSLIEGLQGALTYIGHGEDYANRYLAAEIREIGNFFYNNPQYAFVSVNPNIIDWSA